MEEEGELFVEDLLRASDSERPGHAEDKELSSGRQSAGSTLGSDGILRRSRSPSVGSRERSGDVIVVRTGSDNAGMVNGMLTGANFTRSRSSSRSGKLERQDQSFEWGEQSLGRSCSGSPPWRRGRSPPANRCRAEWHSHEDGRRSRSRQRSDSIEAGGTDAPCRSRSRSRQRSRLRNRSRDRSRHSSRDRSRDRSRLVHRSRDRSTQRGSSRKRSRERSRERDCSPTHRPRSDRERREAGVASGFDTLFVGDLHWKVTSRDLYDLFDALVPGGVLEARVMAGKSYGFVTFRDPHVAHVMLGEAGEGGTGPMVCMQGRTLRVAKADMHNDKRGGGDSHHAGTVSPPLPSDRRRTPARAAPRLHDAHTASSAEKAARAAAAALVSSASALLQQSGARAILESSACLGPYGSMDDSRNGGPVEHSRRPNVRSGASHHVGQLRGSAPGFMGGFTGMGLPGQTRHVLSYDDL